MKRAGVEGVTLIDPDTIQRGEGCGFGCTALSIITVLGLGYYGVRMLGPRFVTFDSQSTPILDEFIPENEVVSPTSEVIPTLVDPDCFSYVIEHGDTLSELALKFDTTLEDLRQENQGVIYPLPSGSFSGIETGDQLVICPDK